MSVSSENPDFEVLEMGYNHRLPTIALDRIARMVCRWRAFFLTLFIP